MLGKSLTQMAAGDVMQRSAGMMNRITSSNLAINGAASPIVVNQGGTNTQAMEQLLQSIDRKLTAVGELGMLSEINASIKNKPILSTKMLDEYAMAREVNDRLSRF
jgi:hypothetical protein